MYIPRHHSIIQTYSFKFNSIGESRSEFQLWGLCVCVCVLGGGGGSGWLLFIRKLPNLNFTQFKGSHTSSCVLLSRPTTSSGWQLLILTLFNLWPNICKLWCLNTHFYLIIVIWSFSQTILVRADTERIQGLRLSCKQLIAMNHRLFKQTHREQRPERAAIQFSWKKFNENNIIV